MSSPPRRADAYAVVGAMLAGVYFAFGVVAQMGRGYRGLDVFEYSHPNFLYAWDALQRGHGLIWNDLQNCGQPFFAIISTALLNPVNWISFVADPETALLPKIAVNLAIGGVGMYFLCREIGLGRLAAFCGTLAFELGGVCGELGRWGSFGLGTYVWLPAAAFFCERILRAPSARSGIGLGIVLSLMLFGGYPQILFFAYQWVALRALFEVGTRRSALRVRALQVLGLGLLLPLLLGAVQLVPSTELVAESVRDRALTADEIQPHPSERQRFESFRKKLEVRMPGLGGLFPVVAVVLAGFAFAAPAGRRLAAFYLACGGLYFALAFFPPLFELYQHLPFGRTFRRPARFVWMTGMSLSVLVAFGVQAFSGAAALAKHDRLVGAGAILCGLAALHFLSPIGFTVWEWGLLAATLAVLTAEIVFSPVRPYTRLALAGLLVSNLIVLSLQPPMNSAQAGFSGPVDPSLLWQNKWAFELVKRRRGEQDRMYPLGEHFDYTLTAKSASIYGVPSIADDERQVSKRYAELFVYMLSDRPMLGLNDFYYPQRRLPGNRVLLNLLAARYLVVNTEAEENVASLRPALQLLERRESVSVYENRVALPRAFYVPRVEVVRDPGLLLDRLASEGHRPRRVALIEEPPTDGFMGLGPPGTGSVEIVASLGEELVIDVLASQAGFLFVSDQYYPGWEATVDGAAAPIHRANYAFRAVRVPEGESTVVFRYRPASLRVGAAVSGISLLAVVVYLIGDAARRRRDGKRSASGPG